MKVDPENESQIVNINIAAPQTLVKFKKVFDS